MKTSDVILVLFFLSLIDIPLNLVTVAAAAKSFQSWPDSTRAHRRQPTRLPRPWDSPGNNTGVGCHFLFQCMNVKSESEVAQLCPTPSDPMDCSQPGPSIHGIFQARVLEWGAISYSKIYLFRCVCIYHFQNFVKKPISYSLFPLRFPSAWLMNFVNLLNNTVFSKLLIFHFH